MRPVSQDELSVYADPNWEEGKDSKEIVEHELL